MVITGADRLLLAGTLVAGAAVWVAFAFFNTEPWDTPYGIAALFAAGLVFGYAGKEHPLLWTLGIFVGQALAGFASLLFHRGGGANLFFPIGAALRRRAE